MTLIYNALFVIFAVVYFPYLLLKRKWHPQFSMRFGRFPGHIVRKLESGENIWIHAVSVGEALSVAAVIRHLKNTYPQKQIVVTTVTQTGYQMAKSVLQEQGVVLYAPLDMSFCVRRFIDLIRPQIYIAAETEIWPNLFHILHQRHIPLIQINGRMSLKSYRGYRLFRWLTARVLKPVRFFCVQTREDAQRFIALGADAEKIEVVGNLKFDDLSTPAPLNRSQLGLDPSDIVWVAGSTHPGEEAIILGLYKELCQEFASLRLIIAPRHVERCVEIDHLAEREGLTARRFSRQSAREMVDQNEIILVDTIGHLRSLYGLADIVFVGKSLTVGGGHNIIEPAYFSKPILVGPLMDNFQDVTDLFRWGEGVIQVSNSAELGEQMKDLMKHPAKRERLGQNARMVIEQNTGATKQTLTRIKEIINSSPEQ